MKDKLIISAYGSHNASICMWYKNQFYIIELERWLNSKNIGLVTYLPSEYPQIIFDEITDYLLSLTDRSDVDVLITGYMGNVKPKFNVKEVKHVDHHLSHASTALYQSSYQEALIVSMDGGGDNAFFNVYHGNRKSGITLIKKYNQDLGFPYMVFGDYLKDIKKDPLNIGNLVYAGKLMGLCSFGQTRNEWLPYFEEFYEKFDYIGSSYLGGAEVRIDALPILFKQLGFKDFDLHGKVRYDGPDAWDIAATSQQAFENQFFKMVQPYLDQYPDLPVCLAGGCALNVILNSKLLKLRNNKVFVPPNVNDCGIATGQLLHYLKPEHQIDLTYAGTPILDKNQFGTYIQERDLVVYENVSIQDLATFIANGNIVGMIQGGSEHGSRALGNRSILCAPSEGMKDTLNHKVKHREWYRPFAPIVRLEEAHKYFEWDENIESRHMTFVANVREEWRSTLPAITHVDNSARLQTVTQNQNSLIYDLITEFEKITGYGVILNTSFNVNSKPILTRLSDAFKILRESELDAVYYEGNLILKSRCDNFKNQKQKIIESALSNDETIYVISFKNKLDDIKKDISIINELKEKKHKIIVLTSNTHKQYYKEIETSESCKIYYMSSHKDLFYNERIKQHYKIDASVISYSKLIRLLWIKDILKENIFSTKYHAIVNLDAEGFTSSILRDFEMITNLVKDNDHVLVSNHNTYQSIYPLDSLKNKYKVDLKKYPNSSLMYGKYDHLLWSLQNYEGMFLWNLDHNNIGTEEDYLLMSYAENQERYKFL